jgi:hypothetical protein
MLTYQRSCAIYCYSELASHLDDSYKIFDTNGNGSGSCRAFEGGGHRVMDDISVCLLRSCRAMLVCGYQAKYM